MIICINHSQREATYEVPEDFCDLCWMMWFSDSYEKFASKDELVDFRKEELELTWSKYGSPGKTVEDEIIKEMKELTEKEYG